MSDYGEYFQSIIKRDKGMSAMPVLKKPCGDCAVTHGLYTEIAMALKCESSETRKAISEKWWCHNHPERACRGNWDIAMAEP